MNEVEVISRGEPFPVEKMAKFLKGARDISGMSSEQLKARALTVSNYMLPATDKDVQWSLNVLIELFHPRMDPVIASGFLFSILRGQDHSAGALQMAVMSFILPKHEKENEGGGSFRTVRQEPRRFPPQWQEIFVAMEDADAELRGVQYRLEKALELQNA